MVIPYIIMCVGMHTAMHILLVNVHVMFIIIRPVSLDCHECNQIKTTRNQTIRLCL